MKNKKTKLENLTSDQIEAITKKAEKRKNVPLIKSKQINMRIDPVHLERIQIIAKQCGMKPTTFISRLLLEDINRLWEVYKKAS
jgi:predicted DNA binding CopG/RHH family protein